MKVLCGYKPQRESVHALLMSTGLVWQGRITWVDGAMPLRGMEGAYFINVTNHPEQPPHEVFEAIRIYGFITIDLSDEYLRGRRTAQQAGERV